MEKPNADIRCKLRFYQITGWKVAKELGISISSFYNLLNSDISLEKRIAIEEIIDRLKN